MYYLIKQFLHGTECRGKSDRLHINSKRNKIHYRSPNQTVFIIDCSKAGMTKPPCITSPRAGRYGAHTPNGRVALAVRISGLNLDRILFHCDLWANSMDRYEHIWHLPSNPTAIIDQCKKN